MSDPKNLKEELEEAFDLKDGDGQVITEELIEELTNGRGDDDDEQ